MCASPSVIHPPMCADMGGTRIRRTHSTWLVGSWQDEGSAMLGWVGNIEQVTKDNINFRAVIQTGVHSQLTVMSVPPGGEVGWEAHAYLDQFLRLEQGTARADFGVSGDAVDESHEIEDDWAVIVPAGVWHNVVNTGDVDLKLYSIYSPPEHADGTVHRTKADADAAEEHH
jgi:mannose-6-phosphate isomerase-like protein (cupin superfamily)